MIPEIGDFYNKTKFYFDQLKKAPEESVPFNWIRVFYKTYPRFPKIPLKKFKTQGELDHLLLSRSSRRDFIDTALSLSSIEKILYFSLGIKENQESEIQKKRFYPSAGARFPIEAYLIANNIEGLGKGLYHYSVKNNELEILLTQDLRKESNEIFGDYISNKNPNFLVLNGVISRTEVKYGINAYRFALLESGHIGQNISLLSEREGIGCCALGGFDNDKLSKLMDLTQDEISLYSFALGNLQKDGKQ